MVQRNIILSNGERMRCLRLGVLEGEKRAYAGRAHIKPLTLELDDCCFGVILSLASVEFGTHTFELRVFQFSFLQSLLKTEFCTSLSC